MNKVSIIFIANALWSEDIEDTDTKFKTAEEIFEFARSKFFQNGDLLSYQNSIEVYRPQSFFVVNRLSYRKMWCNGE